MAGDDARAIHAAAALLGLAGFDGNGFQTQTARIATASGVEQCAAESTPVAHFAFFPNKFHLPV
jgi:hypothetical protein